ncbi:uncharacterized protein KGF55_001504 [Candida pseudojiufengensis]|uniref:uncharacterized protein n=1 Tax=Candida pseudojiufengensis TaxID=497109 RepID=UPI0022249C8D|nr:uncharacterized protein KGF55_001504 [Candida pseudojiufengensis]KAI5965284.1 hypothetical protein KGF55_001504 [Candida pseudojiufengensis]
MYYYEFRKLVDLENEIESSNINHLQLIPKPEQLALRDDQSFYKSINKIMPLDSVKADSLPPQYYEQSNSNDSSNVNMGHVTFQDFSLDQANNHISTPIDQQPIETQHVQQINEKPYRHRNSKVSKCELIGFLFIFSCLIYLFIKAFAQS